MSGIQGKQTSTRAKTSSRDDAPMDAPMDAPSPVAIAHSSDDEVPSEMMMGTILPPYSANNASSVANDHSSEDDIPASMSMGSILPPRPTRDYVPASMSMGTILPPRPIQDDVPANMSMGTVLPPRPTSEAPFGLKRRSTIKALTARFDNLAVETKKHGEQSASLHRSRSTRQAPISSSQQEEDVPGSYNTFFGGPPFRNTQAWHASRRWTSW